MTKNKKYKYQGYKKRNGKALKIVLLISGILMTGFIALFGLNDWDVKKSFEKIGTAVGMTVPQEEEVTDTETPEHPEVEDIEDVTPEEPETPVEDPETGTEQESIPEDETEKENEGSSDKGSDAVTNPDTSTDNGGYLEGQQLPSEPTYIKGILVASKKYPLPSTYAPGEDKVARAAFDEMAAEALLSGFNLTAFSTYRSFEYQTSLYERYVTRDGRKAADRYSARPGYSEHQSGLGFDIGEANFQQHWASSSFGDTEAGKWVAANAHYFGFILRYPEGKESITGYMHESWHFRYVGIEHAEEIFKQNLTLEEYLGI